MTPGLEVWKSPHMSMFALLGGGVRVRVWIREQRKIKGTTKPLMANLDITRNLLGHLMRGVQKCTNYPSN